MAEFDPQSGDSPGFSLNGRPKIGPDQELDDVLRSTLHRMSAHAGIADLPTPAAQIRTRGSRRRDRRTAGVATLAGAAVLTAATFALAGLTGISREVQSPAPVTEHSRQPDPSANIGQAGLPSGCCTSYGRCSIGPGLNHFRSGSPCTS
jgi:hypothetical protein